MEALPILRVVRRLQILLLGLIFGLPVLSGQAASARLVKVLHHFMDQQSRIALNPSLYERDAYQVQLRTHPAERSGLRFDVQWKSRDADRLTLKIELRGNRGKVATTKLLEQPVRFRGLFSTWSRVTLTGEEYQKFGELSAWRATLWDGDKQIAEQASFLWQ
jgi:hypothetical protein